MRRVYVVGVVLVVALSLIALLGLGVVGLPGESPETTASSSESPSKSNSTESSPDELSDSENQGEPGENESAGNTTDKPETAELLISTYQVEVSEETKLYAGNLTIYNSLGTPVHRHNISESHSFRADKLTAGENYTAEITNPNYRSWPNETRDFEAGERDELTMIVGYETPGVESYRLLSYEDYWANDVFQPDVTYRKVADSGEIYEQFANNPSQLPDRGLSERYYSQKENLYLERYDYQDEWHEEENRALVEVHISRIPLHNGLRDQAVTQDAASLWEYQYTTTLNDSIVNQSVVEHDWDISNYDKPFDKYFQYLMPGVRDASRYVEGKLVDVYEFRLTDSFLDYLDGDAHIFTKTEYENMRVFVHPKTGEILRWTATFPDRGDGKPGNIVFDFFDQEDADEVYRIEPDELEITENNE
jgi:hypothetical protein